MSDLISRSELLKEIEKYKFGAISNDAEREYIKKTILDFIICQPTAYDVDKVVDELEEMIHPKQLYFCKYARGGCKHLDNNDKDCMECVVENTIEIVKQGGVYDNVCEWKYKHPFGDFPSCRVVNSISRDRNWKYCPYCGKKIKVVE